MNIYLDTVGCRLNQSEIETYARQLRCSGHTLADTPEQADLVIINTCTVTAQAASDSRQKIRHAARLGAAKIVVTGCWATLEPEAAGGLPHVSHVISNLCKDTLVTDLFPHAGHEFAIALLPRQPLPGARQRTRAFIKAQDGCNNRCTYCITCLARGPSRSRSFQAISQDVDAALAGGCREIVLTGVHLGAWGADLFPVTHLSHLIQSLLAETSLPRLRLSSLEPWDLEPGFFELWQDARLCPHLHLPLQSGCSATLHRMARKTTPQAYAALIRSARAAIPDIAITTDVIVGFPGENEAEFSTSLEFIRSMEFAHGHVFTYSARPDTLAARMSDQVPHQVRKQRSRLVRELFSQAQHHFHARSTGCQRPVLWESAQPINSRTWQLRGLTDNYIRVTAQSPENLWNQISLVHLETVSDTGMQGIIYDRSKVNP